MRKKTMTTSDETTELQPMRRYLFRSVRGEAVIRSRMGEAAARRAAMKHFWGGIAPSIPSEQGLGLSLMEVTDV